MKAFLILAGAATALTGCATTSNEDMAPPPVAENPNMVTSAPVYMRMAASSDLFEIESSRLALQRSQNPAVRQFAQMMITDHTRTSNEMMGIAQSLGLPPPPQMMEPHHQQMLERLRAAAPGDFERAYRAEQIAAHQEALNLHQTYAQGGDTPQLRDFAARTVPAIQMHYQHAQMLPETAMMPPQPGPRPGERG